MILAAAFALVTHQVQPVAPQDTAKARDTVRLGTIVVRETAKPHRYTALRSPTATKVNASLRDTPQSVSVITSAVIREKSMLSMADALRYVPGITMGQGEGHRDAPTIRGNSSTADFFVDGVRDDVQYFRDLYNAERVEALGGSNAMTFGRGGAGGVINRVTKRARFESIGDFVLEGGAFDHGRATVDVGGRATQTVAVRLNAMLQNSRNFREAFSNSRLGVSPQATILLGPNTVARLGVEYVADDRTVDRGLPSYRGRPSGAPRSLFFGNPDSSYSESRVRSSDATIEHQAGDWLLLRSNLRFARYDKFYQNVYPGSGVDTSGSSVKLAAYNNDTFRQNLFSQTEATVRLPYARIPQTLLVGLELGRQTTDNVRQTGYFNGTATSLTVPVTAPTVTTPVEFRPSSSDANNHVLATVSSVYAQDQLWLTSRLQATLGVRFERFDLSFHNNRTPQDIERVDHLVSPRAGLVFKPIEPVSVYSSYSVSHLPGAGDQFSSLTPSTKTLEPERFTNREMGVKWDVTPSLSVTGAAYRLMRTNSAAPSALDPGVYVQTGEQETVGYEFSLRGRIATAWDVLGSFADQRATIVSATTAAPAGATVPLVPRHTWSLWNRLQARPSLGVGLGAMYQSDMYAAIDNTVTIPAFWRFDGAVYINVSRNVALQANVENLFDRAYYPTSHGNNNIMPGAPRTVRVSLTTSLR